MIRWRLPPSGADHPPSRCGPRGVVPGCARLEPSGRHTLGALKAPGLRSVGMDTCAPGSVGRRDTGYTDAREPDPPAQAQHGWCRRRSLSQCARCVWGSGCWVAPPSGGQDSGLGAA